MIDSRLINSFYDCKKVRLVFVNKSDIDFYSDEIKKIELYNNFLTIVNKDGNSISVNMDLVNKILYYN